MSEVIEDAMADLASVIGELEGVAASIRTVAPKVAQTLDQRADALRSDLARLSLSLPRPVSRRAA